MHERKQLLIIRMPYNYSFRARSSFRFLGFIIFDYSARKLLYQLIRYIFADN
jgi:hypothetical protein